MVQLSPLPDLNLDCKLSDKHLYEPRRPWEHLRIEHELGVWVTRQQSEDGALVM